MQLRHLYRFKRVTARIPTPFSKTKHWKLSDGTPRAILWINSESPFGFRTGFDFLSLLKRHCRAMGSEKTPVILVYWGYLLDETIRNQLEQLAETHRNIFLEDYGEYIRDRRLQYNEDVAKILQRQQGSGHMDDIDMIRLILLGTCDLLKLRMEEKYNQSESKGQLWKSAREGLIAHDFNLIPPQSFQSIKFPSVLGGFVCASKWDQSFPGDQNDVNFEQNYLSYKEGYLKLKKLEAIHSNLKDRYKRARRNEFEIDLKALITDLHIGNSGITNKMLKSLNSSEQLIFLAFLEDCLEAGIIVHDKSIDLEYYYKMINKVGICYVKPDTALIAVQSPNSPLIKFAIKALATIDTNDQDDFWGERRKNANYVITQVLAYRYNSSVFYDDEISIIANKMGIYPIEQDFDVNNVSISTNRLGFTRLNSAPKHTQSVKA